MLFHCHIVPKFRDFFKISFKIKNMKKLNIIALVLVVFGIQISFSQVKDENIGSEVVNIVKPYTPTISDAFKVKETLF